MPYYFFQVRGQVVYFGPNGDPLIEFAHGNYPDVKPMEAGYNEAEWLVDMVTEVR